ncbi:hypothetical protein [Chitinophaga nivalis]|uniref:Uncharacterized protein n=1 Tax=Chitinophaga nivalis TaxID=2991709 RepID=A0ABT3IQ31_9BACT|nr:hypothetical protein [Chitinophaga nivalis]MCW3464404.1 hypothetical protein [Chitinophaga nivalis]MCW3485905.1 hypothetical protein [Chitinophaga nivalis]
MKNLICLLLVMGAACQLTQAQEQFIALSNEDAVLPEQREEDLVTRIFGKNKELLLNDFLRISTVETEAFKSVLLEYETEKKPWLTERIALQRMYNEEFSSLDEPKMNSLTRQMINNDLEFGRLQMRYFRRMNRLLGATRAAKFFQLDNYLEQSSRAFMQKQLPFIRELEVDRQQEGLFK